MVEIMKPLLLQFSLSHLQKGDFCSVDGWIDLVIYKYVTQQ